MAGVMEKLRWSVAQRGVLGTLRVAVTRLGRRPQPEKAEAAHPFDLRHGLDTGGLIGGGDLGVGHRHDPFITGYVGAPPSRFVGSMDRWRTCGLPHPVEKYAFVDIGCGKGRAVLLASEMGFREVVGVELNPMLAKVARSNVRAWQAAGRAGGMAIRIECVDATEVSWPAAPCLVYLYNPFGAEVMGRLVERLREEFPEGSRGLEVLYQNPEQAEAFADGFELMWCEVVGMSAEDEAAEMAAGLTDECRGYRR